MQLCCTVRADQGEHLRSRTTGGGKGCQRKTGEAVRGSTTKNGKDAYCNLTADLADDLKKHLPADAVGEDFVFPHVPLVPELGEDLQKAGVPFVDELGRRLDFHALRQTFNTHLAVSGVSLRERMAMMRHSDSKLTQIDYMDVQKLGLHEALAKLPAVRPAGWHSQTDSQIDSQTSGISGNVVASAGTQDNDTECAQSVDSEEDGHELALCGTAGHGEEIGGGCRNRTDS